MAIDPDPYRTLGVARGASREEIRRAYRALAKIHHPDAAGPAALPRFLAIQAAYEQLILRSAGRSGRNASGRPGAPRRPWEADPDRTDATRRAYGGRSRTSGTNGSAPPRGETPGTPGGTSTSGDGANGTSGAGATAGANGAAGGSGRSSTGWRTRSSQRPGARASGGAARDAGERPRTSGGGTSPSGGRGEGRRRNKATLGSTSYDDAGPFEPDWAGASWYGTTSGTYWTVNPKEYADPRKHGPEYQARARRASQRHTGGRGAAPDPGAPPGSTDGDAPSTAPGTSTGDPASADATHTTSTWWESTAASGAADEEAADAGATTTSPAGSRAQPRPRIDSTPPDLGRALGELGRAIADEHVGGARARVARAVIGWLPIAFGIGWAIGEITGCGRFAASCDGATGPFVLLLQGLLLAILILVPPLASIAAVAAMSLLGVAVVASLVLSATGEAASSAARQLTLGSLLIVGWLTGFAIALARRVRELPTPGRPVS